MDKYSLSALNLEDRYSKRLRKLERRRFNKIKLKYHHSADTINPRIKNGFWRFKKD